DHGHYSFGYDIQDAWGNVNGRHETGTGHDGVHGSYYLGEVDGRHRYVEYVADKFGFRAVVKTNEHGTKTSLPAAAPYVAPRPPPRSPRSPRTPRIPRINGPVPMAPRRQGLRPPPPSKRHQWWINAMSLFIKKQVSVFSYVWGVCVFGGAGGGGGHTVLCSTDHGHYRFGYDIANGYGAVNGRHEKGAAYGPVHGSYYLGDVDGRHRRVEYVADKLGFRAVVKTNEPGTKTSLPAAA
ncbi:unnamed protein product, partial [Ixodes pacificus]